VDLDFSVHLFCVIGLNMICFARFVFLSTVLSDCLGRMFMKLSIFMLCEMYCVFMLESYYKGSNIFSQVSN